MTSYMKEPDAPKSCTPRLQYVGCVRGAVHQPSVRPGLDSGTKSKNVFP